VSPQSPGRGWNPDTLNALLERIIRKYRVDKDRVYLTGLSMGGYGTWALAAEHPEKFAAIVPICGGGNRVSR
jgi:predicted peptidase